MRESVRMVVLGDSFAFTDAAGPQLPDVGHLFPNVVATHVAVATGREVATTVVARAGSTLRDLWRTLTKDRHVIFDVLAHADAVVLAVGSYDLLPAGVPPWVKAAIPHVRSARLRRSLRRAAARSNPSLVRVTRGRSPVTPLPEIERLLHRILPQIQGLTHGGAAVMLGPAGHRAAHHAAMNPHLTAGADLMGRVAEEHGFAYVDARSLLEPFAGQLNVDGIHWPAAAHHRVGAALAHPLVAQLEGSAPRPRSPWDDLEL